MFKKKILVVAVGAVIAATTVGLTGCDSGGDTTTTSGVRSEVRNPKGSVQGVVMDTNGNFIEGATVVLGDQTKITNAGGQYYFANVQAVNAHSTDNQVGANVNPPNTPQALIVSIIGPAEGNYLNATVQVTPEAQIDGNADNGAALAGMTNPVNTFIDGFVAQATTAILPTLTASVKGILRDCDTGEPLSGKRVSLDMNGVNRTGQGDPQPVGGGTSSLNSAVNNVSYSTGNYFDTTGSDGSFTILNVPADSQLELYSSGYISLTGQVNNVGSTNRSLIDVSTTFEGEAVDVGAVQACMMDTRDITPPVVTTLDGTVGNCPVQDTALYAAAADANTARVELRDGVDGSAANPIVVNFSEKMAPLTDGAIYVRQWNPTNTTAVNVATTATLAGNGKSASLVLDVPIPMGPVNFDVMIVQPTTDIAGNALVLNDNLNPQGAADFRELLDVVNPANNSALVLGACTFKDVTAGTPGTLAQSVGGEATEDENNDFNGTLVNHSQNLDSSDIYVPADGPRQGQAQTNVAMDRLDELEDTRDNAAANTHDSNTALLTFVAGNAPRYGITITRTAADAATFTLMPAASIAITDDLGNPVGGALASGANLPQLVDGDTYSITITNVVPDDTVTIQPTDAFGYALGDPATVMLVDNTRPTTVLQHAYRDDNAATTTPKVVSTTGDGGELAWGGQAQQIGTPLLPITPHLIDMLDAAGNDISAAANRVADRTLDRELSNRSKANKADMMVKHAYDTTAFNAMEAAGLSRNIGVAFSENITISADPTESTTAKFDSCVAQNDTLVRVHEALVGSGAEDAGAGPNPTNEALDEADLVRCKTDDVLTLANTDHGKNIDFNTVVADAAGNLTTADSRAQVVVQDDMPPFMTFAAFDGQKLELQFNERVNIANSPVLTFRHPKAVDGNNDGVIDNADKDNDNVRDDSGNIDFNLTLTSANTTIDSTGMKLSVNPGSQGGTLLANIDDTANSTYVYAEASAYYTGSNYTSGSAPTTNATLGHGILDFSDMQDARGNSWDDWIDTNGAYADAADRYSDTVDATDIDRRVEFENPRFMVAEAIGPFESSITVDGYQSLDAGVNSNTTDQVVIISFTHPVKWKDANITTDLDYANGDANALAKLNAFYSLGNGSAFIDNGTANANDLIVISDDQKTLTIRFRTQAPVANNLTATLTLQTNKYFTSALTDETKVEGAGTSISPKK